MEEVKLGNESKSVGGMINNTSPTKVERKIIEKNRRNHMKKLYSILNSLLPHQISMEPLSVPDQIDAAVEYIKSMQRRLKECEEKKQKLMHMGRKRSSCTTSSIASETITSSSSESFSAPRIEIHSTGSTLEIILITGTENQFVFQDIIGILNQEGAQVENATYSMVGNSIFHTIHAKVSKCTDGENIIEKLNKFVYGSNIDEDLLEKFWDVDDSHPQFWDLPAI